MLDAVFQALQEGKLSLSEHSDEDGLAEEGTSPGLSVEIFPPCEESHKRNESGASRPPGQHTAGRLQPHKESNAEGCRRAFDSGDSSSKTGPQWTSDAHSQAAGPYAGLMSKRSSHSTSVVSTRSSEKGPLMGARGVFAKTQHAAKDPVCIHWKTKGWCRYNDQCKFDHPLALRGVEAVPMSGFHSMASPISASSSGLPSSSYPFGVPQQHHQPQQQQTPQMLSMQHQQHQQQQSQMQHQQPQQHMQQQQQLHLPQQTVPQQQQQPQLYSSPSTMPMSQNPSPMQPQQQQQPQQQPQQQQQGYQMQFQAGSSPMSMPIVIAGMTPDGTLLGGFSCQQGMVPHC